MKEEIRISVIVPIYNTEEYLEECIESLLDQTIPFYEIILVNDGSTDESGKICERYCEKNESIRLIQQKNQGQGTARNNGICVASGDYIAFVDSDDMVTSEMNELIQETLSHHRVEVLGFSADVKDDIDGFGRKSPYIRKNNVCNRLLTGKAFFLETYRDNYIVSPCCAVYLTEFLKRGDFLFPQGIVYEDNPFYLAIMLNAKEVWCIEDQLYVRRYRKESTTTGVMTKKKCCDCMAAQYEMWKILKESDLPVYHVDVLKDYLLGHVLTIQLMICEYGDVVGCEDEYVEQFIAYWENLWHSRIEWNDLYVLLLLKKLWSSTEENTSEFSRQFFEKIETDTQNVLKSKLTKIPLQKKQKVGIYGLGKHTEALMRWYEKFSGEVRAEVYFIVSHKTMDYFMSRKVVGVNEIPRDTDTIVISSKRYQEEMINKLCENKVDFCKVMTIYESEDKYDLTFLDVVG